MEFPWLVGKYRGATFILVYLIFLAILGYPLLLNEIVVGRRAQRNIVGAYNILAKDTPLYYLGLIAVWIIGVIITFIMGIPSVLSFTPDKFFGIDFFSKADYIV